MSNDAAPETKESPGEVVRLGEVSAPSGMLMVVDMGYLNLWSHDREPEFPEDASSEETVVSANAAIDLEVVGPDAEEAGRRFDRQWHPRFIYDIPASARTGLAESFQAVTSEFGLDATLRELPKRVTHRQRVAKAISHAGAGEVQFHGVWASVVGNVPSDRKLTVFAERMTKEPHTERWRRVFVECQPGKPIARSEQVGHSAVDWARLMFVDVDSLEHWKHEEPIDGKADFLFWGRDAEELAKAIAAPSQGENSFGWVDMPVAKVVKNGSRAEEIRDEKGWKLATDFRPHSHHFAVMQQVRSSETESGTLVLGGASVCGFMTSWGDGIFPVFRDLAADGSLVRIRIETGTDERVELMRKVEERWKALSKCALVSKRVAEDGHPVRFMYREAADRDDDSGWRIFAGNESQAYTDDPNNTAIIRLHQVCEWDDKLEALLLSPVGSVFERENAESKFDPVDDFKIPDNEDSATMIDVFYSDHTRDTHIPSDSPTRTDLSGVLGLMDQVLVGDENFLGVVDADGNTLQFAANDDGSIWMEIPSPSEGGSYGRSSNLEDCKKALQEAEGQFTPKSVKGLEFQKW